MDSTPNPYQSPDASSQETLPTSRSIPRWLLFRLHFVPPFILAVLASGEPIQHVTSGFVYFPFIAICMDLGPWTHPLNLILTLCVILVTPSLEIAKRIVADHTVGLRVAQIGIWWLFWILVSAALAFGDYRGP